MEQKDIIKGLQVVCKCKAVKYKTIRAAILAGSNTIGKVREKTGANTGCGKMCTEKILEMIKEYSQIRE